MAEGITKGRAQVGRPGVGCQPNLLLSVTKNNNTVMKFSVNKSYMVRKCDKRFRKYWFIIYHRFQSLLSKINSF